MMLMVPVGAMQVRVALRIGLPLSFWRGEPSTLAEFGYRYRGGRVLPSAGGNVGIFQFERQDNAELAVFFWTTGAPPRLDLDNLGARLWSADGISFAQSSSGDSKMFPGFGSIAYQPGGCSGATMMFSIVRSP